jgi:hypothetical protein
MAKYKRYDYSQSVLIPVSLQEQLVPGTLEFAIDALVERRMDLSVFDDNYQNDESIIGVFAGFDIIASDRTRLL